MNNFNAEILAKQHRLEQTDDYNPHAEEMTTMYNPANIIIHHTEKLRLLCVSDGEFALGMKNTVNAINDSNFHYLQNPHVRSEHVIHFSSDIIRQKTNILSEYGVVDPELLICQILDAHIRAIENPILESQQAEMEKPEIKETNK